MFYVLTDEPRRAGAVEFIRSLNLGVKWSVEIKRYVKNRSKAQNRTYWMWLNVISDYNGDKPEDLHDLFKVKFLGIEQKMVMGENLMTPKSTSDLTTDEFAEYMVKVAALAGSLGIVLPMPDDRGY